MLQSFLCHCKGDDLQYGTAQLQGNVLTHLKCVQDTSKMHAEHVWHIHKTRLKRAWNMSTQVQNFAIKLQHDVYDYHTLFARRRMHYDPERMWAHLECMHNMSGMRAGHVWDACQRYLGAELYCTCTMTSAQDLRITLYAAWKWRPIVYSFSLTDSCGACFNKWVFLYFS